MNFPHFESTVKPSGHLVIPTNLPAMVTSFSAILNFGSTSQQRTLIRDPKGGRCTQYWLTKHR